MKRITQFITVVLILTGCCVAAQAQLKIGTNANNINSSALLELESTTKGLLLPRMTSAQKNAIISPVAGLQIWCTDCSSTGVMQFYTGTSWFSVLISGAQSIITDNPTIINNTSATIGGTITSESAFTITTRGVVYSTTTAPTVANNKTTETGNVGTFTSNLTGLTASTLYYVRAYVTANGGTTYGNQFNLTTTATPLTFQSGGSAICDGSRVTAVVLLSSSTGKFWMDRNLGASQAGTSKDDFNAYGCMYQWGRGNDGHASITYTSGFNGGGTPVNGVTPTRSSTDSPGNALFISSNGVDWRLDGNVSRWQAGSQVNNPCGQGYHVPSQAEYQAEITAYGITNVSTAYSNGPSPGFKFTTSGYRSQSDGSLNTGTNGYYWTSTATGTSASTNYIISTGIFDNFARSLGATVRCVKD